MENINGFVLHDGNWTHIKFDPYTAWYLILNVPSSESCIDAYIPQGRGYRYFCKHMHLGPLRSTMKKGKKTRIHCFFFLQFISFHLI